MKNIKVTAAFKIKSVLFYALRALVHFDWLILIIHWEIVRISQIIKHGSAIVAIHVIGKPQYETVTLCWNSRENANIPAADSHVQILPFFKYTIHFHIEKKKLQVPLQSRKS